MKEHVRGSVATLLGQTSLHVLCSSPTTQRMARTENIAYCANDVFTVLIVNVAHNHVSSAALQSHESHGVLDRFMCAFADKPTSPVPATTAARTQPQPTPAPKRSPAQVMWWRQPPMPQPQPPPRSRRAQQQAVEASFQAWRNERGQRRSGPLKVVVLRLLRLSSRVWGAFATMRRAVILSLRVSAQSTAVDVLRLGHPMRGQVGISRAAH